ncbi:MAG: pyridoxamine 5'-phosphate oxidase family protein [Actinomycetota bacterium]
MDTRSEVDLDTARRSFAREAVVRVATIGPTGPHVVPLWFVWETQAIYCSAFGDTTTLACARRDPRIALTFDAGREWEELGGVVLRGTARALRPGHPDLRGPMSRWYEKYRDRFGSRGYRSFAETTHSLWFLRVVVGEVSWWDHGSGPFAAGPPGR